MNRPYVLTDGAIRAALTPTADVRAPYDLAASIRSQIEKTPQRRPSILATFVAPASRPVRMLALAAIVGLLALVGVLIAIGHRPSVLETLAVDAPMFRGGPARTGAVLGPGPAGTPRIAWDVGVEGPVSNNSPAVVGGVVYVADGGGGVTALDADTGDVRWSIALPTSANTSPAVADGLVVVGDAGGDVVALGQADGKQRWSVHTDDVVRSSPAIADGTVYVGSQDGHLYAIDLAAGTEQWTFDAGGSITRSPAVADGVVITGAAGGILSAVDAKTGTLEWQDHLGTGQIATPSVREGVVYATVGVDDPAAQHRLFALDAATGKERWQWDAPGSKDIFVGSVDRALVVVNSLDDNVYALDVPAAGADAGGDAASTPATPTVRWTFRTGGPVGSSTEIAAGVVFISGGDQTVYAVDEATGDLRWQLPVKGQPGAMAIVGARAYVATDLGRVIAIAGTP